MSFKLEGKKAFVTGSTYGIGLSILKKLKDYGCQVALNSRSRKSVEEAKEILGNNIHGIIGDMSKKDNARNAINEFIYSETGNLKIKNGKVLRSNRKYIYSILKNELQIYFYETPKLLFQSIQLKNKDRKSTR